jgi:hypothetical protein
MRVPTDADVTELQCQGGTVSGPSEDPNQVSDETLDSLYSQLHKSRRRADTASRGPVVMNGWMTGCQRREIG